jgi:hypothetical protein
VNEGTKLTLDKMMVDLHMASGIGDSWIRRELRATRLLEAEQLEHMLLPSVGIITRVENPTDEYEKICRIQRSGLAALEWWIDATDAQRGLVEVMLAGFSRVVDLHLEVMALRASLSGQGADTGGAL